MTFYNVCDIGRFFEMVDRCRGPVLLRGGDGRDLDLRCNHLVRALMAEACGDKGIARLTVSLADRRDLPMALEYMMGAGCVRR